MNATKAAIGVISNPGAFHRDGTRTGRVSVNISYQSNIIIVCVISHIIFSDKTNPLFHLVVCQVVEQRKYLGRSIPIV